MEKQKSQNLPKLIMTMSIIILLGALFGAVFYLLNQSEKPDIPSENKSINQKQLIEEKIALVKNASYIFKDENIKLFDGSFLKEDNLRKLEVKIHENKISFGKLDNDDIEYAAVVLDIVEDINYKEGGSDFFHYYHLAVLKKDNDKYSYVDSIPLGDREKIESILMTENKIIVNMLVRGLEDALCCPTLPSVSFYKLKNNKLTIFNENKLVKTSDWKTYQNEEYGFEFKYLTGENIDFSNLINNIRLINESEIENYRCIEDSKKISGTTPSTSRYEMCKMIIINENIEVYEIENYRYYGLEIIPNSLRHILIMKKTNNINYIFEIKDLSVEEIITFKFIEENEEINNDNQIDISDWKVYKDKDYRFELKHPNDWEYSDNRVDDRGSVTFIDLNDYFEIVMGNKREKIIFGINTPIREMGYHGLKLIKQESISVFGIKKELSYEIYEPLKFEEGSRYIMNVKFDFEEFENSVELTTYSKKESRNYNEQIFKQILSTFKFIEE